MTNDIFKNYPKPYIYQRRVFKSFCKNQLIALALHYDKKTSKNSGTHQWW